MTEATEALSIWEKYGLPGLVIGALLGLIVYVLRSQKDERAEWRTDMKQAMSGLEKANNGLARAVRELSDNLMKTS